MDIQYLLPRAQDLISRAEYDGIPAFMGFLRPEEAAQLMPVLQNRNHIFFGGYIGAQRTYLCIYPDWYDAADLDFPITAVTFSYRNVDKLSHKDFLGAVMATGVKRETVGDILIEDGRAVMFISREIEGYLLTQINCIGRVGVRITKGADEPLPQTSQKTQVSVTVASARLDGVISALCCVSRNKAEQLLKDGCVMIGGITEYKGTKTVNAGAVITVKRYGKFDVLSLDGLTKRGRIVLKANRY